MSVYSDITRSCSSDGSNRHSHESSQSSHTAYSTEDAGLPTSTSSVDDDELAGWLNEQVKRVLGDQALPLKLDFVLQPKTQLQQPNSSLDTSVPDGISHRGSRTWRLRKELPRLITPSKTSSIRSSSQPSTRSSLGSSGSLGWWTPKEQRRKLQKSGPSSKTIRRDTVPTAILMLPEQSQEQLMKIYEELQQRAEAAALAGDQGCPGHANEDGQPFCPDCIGRWHRPDAVKTSSKTMSESAPADADEQSPTGSRGSSSSAIPALKPLETESGRGPRKWQSKRRPRRPRINKSVAIADYSDDNREHQNIPSTDRSGDWSTLDTVSSQNTDTPLSAPSTPDSPQYGLGGHVQTEHIIIRQPLRRSSTRRRLLNLGKKLTRPRRWRRWSRWKTRRRSR